MQVSTRDTSERELRLSFSFERDGLRLEYSLIGVVVHLADCLTAGEPGSPAVPRCVARVALPPGSRLMDVRAETGATEKIGDTPLPIAPLQPPRLGIIEGPEGKDFPPYRRPGEDQDDRGRKLPDPGQYEKPLAEPFPTPEFVPADPERYAEATRRPTALLLEAAEEGLNQVATLELNPVRLTPDGLLLFDPQIDVILTFEPAEDGGGDQRTPAGITSRAQAMRQVALTRRSVVNRDVVYDFSDLLPILNLGTDYLIITDNRRWDAAAMSPGGAAGGDLVASFERLAAWKRSRGLRASVVTITDIMADRYGNFRTGSLDLQEVIRKFLKMAQADWGVAWVLLGGDTAILPVRKVASDVFGEVELQAVNPPPATKSFWTGSQLRVHAADLGVWWNPDPANLLVRQDNGLLIPYDAAGTSSATMRGWYFTTDNTYATRSAMPTNFVLVNGPAGEINANLRYLYAWNTITTDLYYSSLVGARYGLPGQHDWDLSGGEVYGQHGGTNLDGIHFNPTVSLGRAPVRSAAQADKFVEKVIAYEKYERPDGTRLDDAWSRRLVLASENWWGGLIDISSTAVSPPGDSHYHHAAGESHTLIKLGEAPDWDWALRAVVGAGDVRLLPYRTDAAAAGRGWYFATSATDLSANALILSWPGGGVIALPLPSRWIAVYGAPEELAPARYVLNYIGLDSSLAHQEQLRLQLRSEMPGVNEVQRLYQDIDDMTPAQVGAAPLEQITSAGMTAALNHGPHIVSLSGHGSWDSCCQLSRAVADSLTNGYHTFILYADSCLTNQFDGDTMSEHLLENPNGGAVAYIGSTRFSFIALGDTYQRRFFSRWAALGGNAHLGLLSDTRFGVYSSDGNTARWSMLSINLMGDPEMCLWWREPLEFRVLQVYSIDKLRVIIDLPDPPPDLIEAPYSRNWGLTTVHLRQGEHEELVLAGADASAEMPLTGFTSGAATLTVARPGSRPVVQEVQLVRQGQGRGCSPLGWLMRFLGRQTP